MIGFRIGKRTGFYGMPRLFGRGNIRKHLTIGAGCWINIGCHFDLSAPIVIGNGVGIGPEVMIMTGTHEIGKETNRAGKYIALPITIGDGVWIGARCTILPGVTIGKGAVISTGSTVNRDIPPNTILNGTQGMPIEKWMALTKQNLVPRS
ncbi:MAG: acyltransferase [Oscillochloris sp.]|nr:acyltransferase [Oscillochloris sp.]